MIASHQRVGGGGGRRSSASGSGLFAVCTEERTEKYFNDEGEGEEYLREDT